MNRLYRVLHTPPARLFKQLAGYQEACTVALRPLPRQEGCAALPALGAPAYTPLPAEPGVNTADPQLVCRGEGRWLFCRIQRPGAVGGEIAVCELDEASRPGPLRVVLGAEESLAFPTVFEWNGEVYMLPAVEDAPALCLYRCTAFPDGWEPVQRFAVGAPLGGAILLERSPDALTLLCSESKAEEPHLARHRRFTLRRLNGEENQRDGVPFALEEDEAYNLQHRAFGATSRCAGPVFSLDAQTVRPVRAASNAFAAAYLQFYLRRGASEVPLCAATPSNVTVEGLASADILGLGSYCRDDEVEIVDVHYLRKA